MLPVTKYDKYSKKHYGITGRIGEGDNTEVLFLQTSLKMDDLRDIKLIADIEGSEKWGIKDLFQRLVNMELLEEPGGLIEYFKDKNQVKYFNPITLALLPRLREGEQHVLEKLRVESNKQDENNEHLAWDILINDGFFKLYLPADDTGVVGKIEWDGSTCYVVAIDGQHRLTALKKIYDSMPITSSEDDISNWQIPVVFLVPNKIDEKGEKIDFIALIRKIFVYINMKAEEISEDRLILLNDESIECICVQSIVEKIHENDTKGKEKEESYPPLYLMDWLGKKKNPTVLKDSRYLFSNKELRNWIKEYLIGEDASADSRTNEDKQRVRLKLDYLELDYLNRRSKILTNRDSIIIREEFNKNIRDAFIKFLTQLNPVKDYIEACRSFEKKESEDNYQKQVFDYLRYDYEKPEVVQITEYINYRKRFKEELIRIKKDTMSEFFRQDICLRGFVFAYSEIYDHYTEEVEGSIDWMEYTDAFMDSFNSLVKDEWCEGYDFLEDEKKDLLRNICHDDAGRRIFYKVGDVKKAWGIFVMMSALTDAVEKELFKKSSVIQIWESYRDQLKSALEYQYKISVRREVEQEQLTLAERNEKINKIKEEKALAHISKLEELWNIR